MRCVKTKKKSRLIRVRVSRVVGKCVENYHLWNFRFWIAFSQSARRDERHVNQNSIHFLAALRGNQRQQQQATRQIAQNTQSLKRQQLASDYREAAEMIVNEERVANAKKLSYVGLENFKLVDKMGE